MKQNEIESILIDNGECIKVEINIDRNRYVNFLEKIVEERMNREPHSFRGFSELEKLKENDFLNKLKKMYLEEIEYKRTIYEKYKNPQEKLFEFEAILKLTSKDLRKSIKYTKLCDLSLRKLVPGGKPKDNLVGVELDEIRELLCIYHPIKDIRITGLEIIISENIARNENPNYSIESNICDLYSNWRKDGYVFKSTKTRCKISSSFSANLTLISDPFCPVHGDIFYNENKRKKLWKKWGKLIKDCISKE